MKSIFQRIGLPGTWTWPAEYPFTGRTLATEPYGKMTPRLPDGHQIFPNKQMNVIRCDCIVENYQTISLPCFKKPGQPSPSVFGNF
jgi:hypothetical protein